MFQHGASLVFIIIAIIYVDHYYNCCYRIIIIIIIITISRISISPNVIKRNSRICHLYNSFDDEPILCQSMYWRRQEYGMDIANIALMVGKLFHKTQSYHICQVNVSPDYRDRITPCSHSSREVIL